MEIFIRGIGLVSPQPTTKKDYFFEEVKEYTENKLYAVEPEIEMYLDPASSRRMSRILKLGVIAAKICLVDSGVSMPDGIITGTGFGMVEDTEKFLLGLLESEEKFLTPTPFIQSTHNTLGAYVSQMLKCHNYNYTYTHRGTSFETALIDGSMLIEEGNARNVMVGGYEENTENQIRIFDRIGRWKKEKISNLELFQSHSAGTIAGEGVGFFMLSRHKGENTYARLTNVQIYYQNLNGQDLVRTTERFLDRNDMEKNSIDAVLYGVNGDSEQDKIYHYLHQNLFQGKIQTGYKHLCGESYSSTAFALWMAAKMLKTQKVPPVIQLEPAYPKSLNHILIYNHWQNTNHALYLVTKC
jgi:3-oxoacyl-[acyl-carrier-protein] synthase II